MKLVIFVLIFVSLTIGIKGQEKVVNEVQTVPFCDLFDKSKDYEQKTVRVTAIYRYGYEWSDIFCLECNGESLMRFEFGEDFTSKTKREIRRKIKWSPRGKTVKVTVVGKFYRTGLNGDGKRFVADYFEQAKVLFNDSSTDLFEKIKQKENCLPEN